MGKNVTVDFRELERLGEQVAKIQRELQGDFIEKLAKDIAARFLRKVIKRTPVGVYDGSTYRCAKIGGQTHKGHKVTGKVGGTLKRAWTTNNKNMRIVRSGTILSIDIINPTEYASYVEYGHRTPDHTKWIEGHFMMTISAKEIEGIAPALLQKRIEQKLREAFK